jgi:glyoxylase-like metal-dependent hydrolase (beta-lactamase superfamily II)
VHAIFTRRDLLVGAATAAGLALPAARTFPQASELTLVELGERIALVHGAGANITVFDADDGLVLVDAGRAEQAGALIALLESRWPGRAIRDVINTNWRPEHTGANEALRAAGARIHAHENTRLWMGARFEVTWQGLKHLPRPAAALPTDTFYDAGPLELAGGAVRYGHLKRAHTDGDVYVHFPTENVFAVSDLLAVDDYPLPDYETGGWIGGMVAATEALLGLVDADSRVIAAAGPPQSRDALDAQLELCRAAMVQAAATYRAGGTLADYLAAASGLVAGRGDPTLFLTLVYEGGYYHSRELGGIV